MQKLETRRREVTDAKSEAQGAQFRSDNFRIKGTAIMMVAVEVSP